MVNKTHEFYDQIQGQMYMKNRNSCVLVLFTKKEKDTPIVTTIPKDEGWNKNISIITEFYFEKFIPYVCMYHILKCKAEVSTLTYLIIAVVTFVIVVHLFQAWNCCSGHYNTLYWRNSAFILIDKNTSKQPHYQIYILVFVVFCP